MSQLTPAKVRGNTQLHNDSQNQGRQDYGKVFLHKQYFYNTYNATRGKLLKLAILWFQNFSVNPANPSAKKII
ncbi:MAG: hypothetical protein EA361_00700 [Bacteroidetes bacterium]|nr:MAG: hypothetical protein EA361_00700 [Bacteroidota bacterium]